MPKILDEDNDCDLEIKTDNEYAKKYDVWRKKEELNKLKTKYGEDSLNLSEDASSSSSDDDDDGVELTEEVEKQFFKTLSCLKNKDPRIYDANVNFFDDVNDSEKVSMKKKKEKPLYINDYERELILHNNGELSESDNEGDLTPKSPTYIEEQKNIKESFKKVLNDIPEDDDGDWGGILKARQKTEEEKLKEEAEYKEWLAGQKADIEDKEAELDLKPLKEYWSNPNLDDGEKFLRDYILQKKFLTKEDEDYIPTYEEIIHDSDNNLSEDEQTINKQDEFEHKYNFRFEEPDHEFIKRYPRTMEHSLRKTDDKRKIKRAEKKERKQKEKQQKIQELKKLQELKRKEIEEKIEKLKEITGNSHIGFKDEDVDGDFDPEAHDKRMESLFNNEFYQGPEDDQKPQFPELDEYLELENWEKWDGDDTEPNEDEEDQKEEYVPHCEDEDFNMDCDYDPKTAVKDELIENSKGKKKRKRKSLFAKVLKQPKPVFDPNDKTYEEYLDEYYKLDCEDIIGDIPCRFKYRKVVPNNFGLTVEEILMAKDRELNKWCSLKKAVQYRPDHVEKYEQIAYAKKAQNLDLKKKILPSLFKSEETDETDNVKDAKQRGSSKKINNDGEGTETANSIKIKEKKRIKEKHNVSTNNEEGIKDKQKKKMGKNVTDKIDNIGTGKKRKRSLSNESVPKKKVKKNKGKKQESIGISDARLSAYGINPKKFKNKLKYKKKKN